MLSHQTKVQIIADILHDHLKGKHKDNLSKQLAEEILQEIQDESWFYKWNETD